MPLIIGGSLAVLLAIAGVLFLRPGASSAPEPPPVIEAPPPAAVEGEATPPDEAAVPAPEAEAEAAPKPVAPAPAPKPAAPRTGAIYFRTDPAGARIQVDNRPDWTCETPCWLEALSPGQHTVTAKLEGFRVGLERIEVAAGAREPLAIELEADLISAMISSTPPGADIYIDGQKRPEKTNARIPLKPGTYQVRVVLPGGIEGEQVLAVSESQMPFASFTLEAK